MSDAIIPAAIIGQFDPMDPETDYLIPGSNHLQNGMVVLVENPVYRVSAEMNRWSRVSELHYRAENASYAFVATYADGTQRLMYAPVGRAWYVKKDSVQKTEELYTLVRELVSEAMVKQDAATYHGEGSGKDMMELNERISKDIMKLFGMGVGK